MLFSSYEYILFFLPVTFFVYFFLNGRRSPVLGRAWLVAASLFFYAWFNIYYLPILLSSILVNFWVGLRLASGASARVRKGYLVIGILFNVGLLGYFKYADFLIENINAASGASLPLLHLALPLALSFVTFQAIAYLVDAYRGKASDTDLLTFALFISFFPQQIAGPIVHHAEMMPQFLSRWNLLRRYRNIALGLFIFSMGMFKKIVIADTFAVWADSGFSHVGAFTFHHAWVTSLSYTFQLYFDFSGYTDMAIGSALLFNIRLPINFNSPYKACDIQDFWRRWHMTLSRFLRDYIYIPLGGNRDGAMRTYVNLFATFLIGGIWHGASWMFVAWGALHGAALIVHRLWQQLGFRLARPLAWFLTFNFVNVCWIFFRATDLDVVARMLHGMTQVPDILTTDTSQVPTAALSALGYSADWLAAHIGAYGAVHVVQLLAILLAFCLCACRNTSQFYLATTFIGWRHVAAGGIALGVALIASLVSTSQVFLYFNF